MAEKSSNEAIWHIFTFSIHERDPVVVHLAVHLENGQRVYFTELTALQQAITAQKQLLLNSSAFARNVFQNHVKMILSPISTVIHLTVVET